MTMVLYLWNTLLLKNWNRGWQEKILYNNFHFLTWGPSKMFTLKVRNSNQKSTIDNVISLFGKWNLYQFKKNEIRKSSAKICVIKNW